MHVARAGAVGSLLVALALLISAPPSFASFTGRGGHLGSARCGATGAWGAQPNKSPGCAAALVFVHQPERAIVGQVISGAAFNPSGPPVTVEVVDAAGHLVTSSSAPVTIAIGANPGGATLGGTATVDALGGVATFDDLTLDRPGLSYTLAASSPGLTGATSRAFDEQTVAVSCAQNTSCSATVRDATTKGDVSATFTPDGSNAGVLDASLGVGPPLACQGYTPIDSDILYFSFSNSSRGKQVEYTILNPMAGRGQTLQGLLQMAQICFGAPYEFTTSSGAPAASTIWPDGTVEFVGLLPQCPAGGPGPGTGPCLRSKRLDTTASSITLVGLVPAGLPGDPRMFG